MTWTWILLGVGIASRYFQLRVVVCRVHNHLKIRSGTTFAAHVRRLHKIWVTALFGLLTVAAFEDS